VPVIVFDWPWLFLAAPLPWLVRRLLPPAPPAAEAALRLPFYAELSVRQTAPRGGSRARRLLPWLVWLLLLSAAARPQWLGPPQELPLAGRDLMLAVDLSGSMAQVDFELGGRPVDRLTAVKAIAGDFVARRHGDRLGLVLFGSRAYVQTPLTHDRETVRGMLADAVIGLAGRETAIGDAIALAVKRLREQPEGSRVLVLLTDGANTAGRLTPRAAARLAAAHGVRIYTIGIGRAARTGLPAPAARPGTELDPETLAAIAEETGGRYFPAPDTTRLSAVYAELDRLEPSVRAVRSLRPVSPLFAWPAGLALLLSLVAALGLLYRRRAGRSAAGQPHAG
jgi:Ca-activated chloride channel family protein